MANLTIQEALEIFKQVSNGTTEQKLVNVQGYGLVHLEKPRIFTKAGTQEEPTTEDLEKLLYEMLQETISN